MNNTSVLNIYSDYRDINLSYDITSQDYFVHMLRFSKVVEIVRGKVIIDIGCGKYANLLKAVCQMSRSPDYVYYIGLDYGSITKWRPEYAPIWDKTMLIPNFDFTDVERVDMFIDTLTSFDIFSDEQIVITCFEVLEHMDFESQNKFMYNLSRLLHLENLNIEHCLFSTPNHNGSAAKNHVCEISYKLEEEMFDRFDIDVVSAQGLSTWKKFCTRENLPVGANEPKYLDNLPTPLVKMVWAAALPRQFSNNILYDIHARGKLDKEYEQYRKDKYLWEEFRQGGSKQCMCMDLFSVGGYNG